MSLNRWVFKWRLKVRIFSHSRMSAGREFQVDGAATEKARRVSSVCMRGRTSIGASEERRARGGARVCTQGCTTLRSAVSISVFWCHILKMIYKNQCLIGSLLVSGVIKMSETKSYLGFY